MLLAEQQDSMFGAQILGEMQSTYGIAICAIDVHMARINYMQQLIILD